MYANQFSVRVVGGREVDGGYVEIGHGCQYTLQLRNDRDVPCDATVEIDGKHIGIFRLYARGTMTLERPPEDNGRFTFYRAESDEGRKIGAQAGDPNNGLIRVTFTPERKREPRAVPIKWYPEWHEWRPYPWYVYPPTTPLPYTVTWGNTSFTGISEGGGGTYSVAAMPCSMTVNAADASEGVTGLSGHSDQGFYDVGAIEYDYSGQTVIHLRLICKERTDPRPLVPHTTPVPPPVK